LFVYPNNAVKPAARPPNKTASMMTNMIIVIAGPVPMPFTPPLRECFNSFAETAAEFLVIYINHHPSSPIVFFDLMSI